MRHGLGVVKESEDAMRRRAAILLIACLGLLGALAPAASAAANQEHANCFAHFTSNQGPGEMGDSASSNARDPENRPLGLNVVSFTAHLEECFEE